MRCVCLVKYSIESKTNMPAPRKTKSSKPRRRAPTTRRPRARRNNTRNVADYAGCSVKRSLVDGNTNTMYSYDNFQLKDFDRAVQIAQAYQKYRMTGIRVTWKPEYDTFAPGGGGATKPFLYYMIDKSGSLPDNVTLESLKQAGARPIAFDENPISVTFKPAVLQATLNTVAGSTYGGYKVSPLLSTNQNATTAGAWQASAIAHQGIKWYMDTAGSSLAVKIEVEVQFQFYKPIWTALGSAPSKGLTYAELNDSPDGIVGGNDAV